MEVLGETAPLEWTVMELKTRVKELESEQGISRSEGLDPNATDDPRHGRRGQEGGSAGLPDGGAQHVASGKRDHGHPPAEGPPADLPPSDPVTFGKYSNLTYQEVQSQDQEYCRWVMQTNREGSADYRLSRLAQWLEGNPVKREQDTTRETMTPTLARDPKKQGIHHQPVQSLAASSQDGARGPLVADEQSGVNGPMLKVLHDVTQALKTLQGEVTELRTGQSQEPPRKKEKADTEESFEQASTPK